MTPGGTAAKVAKVKRKLKEKKQIIDAVTELEDGPGAKVGRGRNAGLGALVTKDVSDILAEQQFLHRSSLVMRLLEIRDDPLAHFLPTKVTPDGTFLCAAPPGLNPELAELFMCPINSPSSKRRGTSPDKGSNKRPRHDSVNGDDAVEQVRRAGSLAPSIGLGSDILGRGGSIGPDGGLDFADQTIGVEDFQLDIPEFDAGDLDTRAKSAALTDRSRMSTPALMDEGEPNYADATCPIAMFDVRPSSQSQGAEKEVEAGENEGKGYSKNTVKALSVIRRDLKPLDGDDAEDKVLSFRRMADKVRIPQHLPKSLLDHSC